MSQARVTGGQPHQNPGQAGGQDVIVTIDATRPGPAVPGDFAGLSFERGPLRPGNAGVTGYLFSPGNTTLINLFRSLGLRSLRIGGGSVDTMAPAGAGDDGFTGIANLFAFAAAAGVQVIYSLRLLNPGANPVPGLLLADAQAAAYIWQRYRAQLASFAIGNEPDWHSYHSYPGHPLDPAIYETVPGVPGSAYESYLSAWRRFAGAVRDAAPGAPLSGPDTGAYSTQTYTPGPQAGVSWTQRFAADHAGSSEIAAVTQHHYVGGSPGDTAAAQAIQNMLSPAWAAGTTPASQPAGTTCTPYPWLYEHNLAPVAAAGLRYRLTEANDYLTGVPGASDAFASALWALDYLHWWAAHGAAGVNFHNKQWLWTDTIVPDPGAPGAYTISPKGYGIRAFTLVPAGRAKPVTVSNPSGVNLTAYCIGGAGGDYVTIINKSWGAGAADARAVIAPPGPGPLSAEAMTLASVPPGSPASSRATLGGATITGSAPWRGEWSPLPVDPAAGVTLTVGAASATVVRIRRAA
jgi:hypothetical protein